MLLLKLATVYAVTVFTFLFLFWHDSQHYD